MLVNCSLPFVKLATIFIASSGVSAILPKPFLQSKGHFQALDQVQDLGKSLEYNRQKPSVIVIPPGFVIIS